MQLKLYSDLKPSRPIFFFFIGAGKLICLREVRMVRGRDVLYSEE